MGGSAVWTQVMGLLGFCLVMSHLLKHYSARLRLTRATAGLKPLGEELGLEYIPSQYAKGQGVLRGTYAARQVEIDPDETQSIRVDFHASPGIVLLTKAPDKPLPDELVELRPQDEEFASFWRIRQASAEQALAVGERARKEWIEAFRGAWARNIASVSVDPDGVTVVLDFGLPPCIPVRAIRQLLPACVALAEHLEPSGEGAGSQRQQPAAAAPPMGRPELASRGFFATLLVLASLALACRLALAWMATRAGPGSLDRAATWVRYVGRDVYIADSGFGLPPAVIPVLEILDRLAKSTGIAVSFWAAALTACAELGVLLLLWRTVGGRHADKGTCSALLIVACWPAALALAGVSTGPTSLMVACALLSVYWTARHAHALAGAALGLALCTTLGSLYALPALLLSQRGRRAKLRFALGAALVAAVGWLPWWPSGAPHPMERFVPSDASYGRWGLSWLSSQLLRSESPVHAVFESTGPYLLLGLALVMALRANRRGAQQPRQEGHTSSPQATARAVLAQLGATSSLVLLAAPSADLSDLIAAVPLLVLVAPPVSFLFVASCTALALVENTAGFASGYSTPLHLLSAATLLGLASSTWMSKKASIARTAPWPFGIDVAPRGWLTDWRIWAGAGAAALLLPAGLLSPSARPTQGALRAEREARTYVELSSWLLRRERNAPGIEAARQATRLQPGNAVAWNNLAVGHSNQREWDAAIAAATRAVALAPAFQLAKNNLAWAVRHKRGTSRATVRAKQRPSG